MKISAIIRIILGSLIALCLISILVLGLSGGNIFGFIKNVNFPTNIGLASYSYQNSEAYSIGGSHIAAEEINDINVNWVSGDIKIIAYDGDEIVLSETSEKALSESEKLRYLVQDNKLTIQFSAPSRGLSMFFNSIPDKTLELKIPLQLASNMNILNVDSVSAQLDMQNISAEKLDLHTVSGDIILANTICTALTIESVSGKISFNGLTATTVRAENVSGDAELIGNFNELDYQSVSGRVTIATDQAPKKYRIETVSGAIELAIPENDGFIAAYDTVSGSFSCDFPTTSKKEQTVYKNGQSRLDLETVSGNISITKK
ncbi:MAG: DUF4097 family beta strand repeat-containing protein [Clostridia bacterium]